MNSGFLMAVSLRSKDNSVPSDVLNNIVAAQVLDPISRIPGVGQTQQFGAEYSMRIWLNPDKLRSFRLSAADVLARVRGQNVQFATGSLGVQPAVEGQQVVAAVSAEAQFSSKEEFENVILRTEAQWHQRAATGVGACGTRSPAPIRSRRFERPACREPAGEAVVARRECARSGKASQEAHGRGAASRQAWSGSSPFDATIFIKPPSTKMVVTLLIAVPGVHRRSGVPAGFRHAHSTLVVLCGAHAGAFIGMSAFWFLDQPADLVWHGAGHRYRRRRRHRGHRIPSDASCAESVSSAEKTPAQGDDQIPNLIIAISVVLAAVFIPSALQSGSVGMIYQQFAMTIAISMGFSAFLALSLTPALCGTILRPEHLKENRFFKLFNRGYDKTQKSYVRSIKFSMRHQRFWLAGFVVLLLVGGFTFMKVPSSFVPEEDQGFTIGMVMMPRHRPATAVEFIGVS